MRFCKVCGLDFEENLTVCPECGWEYKEIQKQESMENKSNFEYKVMYNGLKLIKANIIKSIEQITIPSHINNQRVVELGSDLFAGFGKLSSISIPNTVRKIGACCFMNCYSLKMIELPDSVVDIGESCFQNCINLQSITFPKTLDRLSKNILRDCKGLECLQLLDSIETFGSFSLAGCISLKRIVLPENLLYISERTFSRCFELKEIVFNRKLIDIGKEAFWMCGGLENVRLPLGMSVVDEGVFKGCIGLQKVICPATIKEIKIQAFGACVNLKQVYILNDDIQLAPNVFANDISHEETESKYEYIVRKLDGTPDYRYNPTRVTQSKIVHEYHKLENVTIYCNPDSNAERYAKRNKLKYKYIV